MAGKGSKWRAKFDFDSYWTNTDAISGEFVPQTKKTVTKKNGKTIIKFKK
jgi:hypothetical protein